MSIPPVQSFATPLPIERLLEVPGPGPRTSHYPCFLIFAQEPLAAATADFASRASTASGMHLSEPLSDCEHLVTPPQTDRTQTHTHARAHTYVRGTAVFGLDLGL